MGLRVSLTSSVYLSYGCDYIMALLHDSRRGGTRQLLLIVFGVLTIHNGVVLHLANKH